MSKINEFPDWVLSQKTKGTTVKKIGDGYYLYKATSKHVPGKKYPVAIQKYIGKITPEGLIEADIRLVPELTEACHLSSFVDEIPEGVGDPILIEADGSWYFTKTDKNTKEKLEFAGLEKDGKLNMEDEGVAKERH